MLPICIFPCTIAKIQALELLAPVPLPGSPIGHVLATLQTAIEQTRQHGGGANQPGVAIGVQDQTIEPPHHQSQVSHKNFLQNVFQYITDHFCIVNGHREGKEPVLKL